jgi:hypothetical protein
LKTKSTIGLICILLAVSCTVNKTGFIVSHKKKHINLTAISDQPKIGYETDSAIIYLGQNDAVQLTESLLTGRKPNFEPRLKKDLQVNLDYLRIINKDTLVQHWQNQMNSTDYQTYDLAGFIDQWLLKDLILKGKAEIWNKSTIKLEYTIIYHAVKDKLGGQSCYFTFQNGSEFHRQIIALGE